MRHRKNGRKLNRTAPHKRAMLSNMATSLLLHERIVTTVPKAKELRTVVEPLITLAKKGDLHARRKALSIVADQEAVAKLFDELAGRFEDRQGGYTRVVKIGPRRGDNAPMAFIELVDAPEAEVEEIFQEGYADEALAEEGA